MPCSLTSNHILHCSQALQQFGENYELISYVLPGRDRKACKNKFKAEDKRNSNRITWCLKNRRPYGMYLSFLHHNPVSPFPLTDMQTLSRMTGKDFSGPTPIIKAPTPLTLDVEPSTGAKDISNEEQLSAERKQSRAPGLGGDGEEIIGSVDGQ